MKTLRVCYFYQVKKKHPVKPKRSKRPVLPAKIAHWDKMTNWVLLLIILLPVVFTTQTPEPVVPIRNILLSAFLLVFGAYFFVIRKQSIRLTYPAWFFVSLGCFWVWSCLTSTQAVNQAESWFVLGQNFSLIILVLFIYQAAQKEAAFIPIMFKTLMMIGLFHAVVGILQFYGLVLPKEPGVVPQAFSANRSLFGSAMMLLLPFAAAVFLTSNNKWRMLAGIAIAVELTSIIISQTRSAWVALFLAFLIVHAMIFRSRKQLDKRLLRWWWWSNLGGMVLLVMTGFVLAQLDVGGWLMESLGDRIKSLFGLAESGTVAASNASERLVLWRQSLQMIGDYPILGTGPGNWKFVAPLYIQEIPGIARGDYALIRPHNAWLQTVVETGIPGGLAYISAWILLLLMAFRNCAGSTAQKALLYNIFLLAGLLGFATDMFFSFPDERPEHRLYFALMSGIVLASYSFQEKKKGKLKIPKWIFLLILIPVAGHLLLSIAHFKHQVTYQKAYAASVFNNYPKTIQLVKEGRSRWVNLGPNADPAELFSSAAFQAQKQLEPALEEALIARKNHPYNYRVLNALGTVYIEMGRYQEAAAVYETCLQLTPQYFPALKNRALNAFFQKKYADCIQYIEGMNWQGDEQLTYMLEESRRQLQ